VGREVHFAARVAAAGRGGQVILSKATADLLDGHELLDFGEHRLKDIAEPVAIYQLGSEAFPPLKTISNTNLPRPASSFIGRERELEEVLSCISDGARLLTLTGPGGSGKTRLSLEAAASLVPAYKAGVFWVGLASLRDPALVTETIAQTLGAKDGLAEHIAERAAPRDSLVARAGDPRSGHRSPSPASRQLPGTRVCPADRSPGSMRVCGRRETERRERRAESAAARKTRRRLPPGGESARGSKERELV